MPRGGAAPETPRGEAVASGCAAHGPFATLGQHLCLWASEGNVRHLARRSTTLFGVELDWVKPRRRRLAGAWQFGVVCGLPSSHGPLATLGRHLYIIGFRRQR